jgi:hypothetical protein
MSKESWDRFVEDVLESWDEAPDGTASLRVHDDGEYLIVLKKYYKNETFSVTSLHRNPLGLVIEYDEGTKSVWYQN